MLKKRIVYVDYDGQKREEDFFFNLNKAELLEMELSKTGGMSKLLQKIVDTSATTQLIPVFKDVIMRAYGEKSMDGKRFIKSQDLSDAFVQSEAYNVLFIELVENAGEAARFISGLMPAEFSEPPQPEPGMLTKPD